MSIKVIDGNIMGATEDIIGHQVNCMGIMGSGVAVQIKKNFYGAFWHYKLLCETNSENREELLGKCQLIQVSSEKRVANLFGQLKYGRDKIHTNYEALRKALEELVQSAKLNGDLSIALPYRIGSDRGGADWNKVYGIIDDVFSDYVVTLYRL